MAVFVPSRLLAMNAILLISGLRIYLANGCNDHGHHVHGDAYVHAYLHDRSHANVSSLDYDHVHAYVHANIHDHVHVRDNDNDHSPADFPNFAFIDESCPPEGYQLEQIFGPVRHKPEPLVKGSYLYSKLNGDGILNWLWREDNDQYLRSDRFKIRLAYAEALDVFIPWLDGDNSRYRNVKLGHISVEDDPLMYYIFEVNNLNRPVFVDMLSRGMRYDFRTFTGQHFEATVSSLAYTGSGLALRPQEHLFQTLRVDNGRMKETSSQHAYFAKLMEEDPDAELLFVPGLRCRIHSACRHSEAAINKATRNSTFNDRPVYANEYGNRIHPSQWNRFFTPQHFQFNADADMEFVVRSIPEYGRLVKIRDYFPDNFAPLARGLPSNRQQGHQDYLFNFVGDKGIFSTLNIEFSGQLYTLSVSLPLGTVDFFGLKWIHRARIANTFDQIMRHQFEFLPEYLEQAGKYLDPVLAKMRTKDDTDSTFKETLSNLYSAAFRLCIETPSSALNDMAWMRLQFAIAQFEHKMRVALILNNEALWFTEYKANCCARQLPLFLRVPPRLISANASPTSTDEDIVCTPPADDAEKKHQCPYCCQNWVSQRELNIHFEYHFHGGHHHCDVCETDYSSTGGLNKHYLTDKSHRLESIWAGLPIDPRPKVKLVYNYQCPVPECFKQYRDLRTAVNHLRTQHPEYLAQLSQDQYGGHDLNKEQIESLPIRLHPRKLNRGSLRCLVCGQRYSRMKDALKHGEYEVLLHQNKVGEFSKWTAKEFIAKDCGEDDPNNNRFRCLVCGKLCNQKIHCANHISTQHPERIKDPVTGKELAKAYDLVEDTRPPAKDYSDMKWYSAYCEVNLTGYGCPADYGNNRKGEVIKFIFRRHYWATMDESKTGTRDEKMKKFSEELKKKQAEIEQLYVKKRF